MVVFSTMRRVWMGVALSVALLSLYPALVGRTSWWLPGLAITFFLIFLLEPFLLTWELRKRGDQLQISDEGVMRRLAKGKNEFVRWDDLREVSVVFTQSLGNGDEYFYVLVGSGKSGVLINQSLAVKHDLVSHLGKLPGFDHRAIEGGVNPQGDQRYVLWRARTLQGEAQVIPLNRLADSGSPPRTLH
jgi:hypothetical protein